MIPEIVLYAMLLVSVANLADSIWRLWRGRARIYRLWWDSLLYVVMVPVIVQLPARETRDVIAKVAFVVVSAALIVITFIGHKRTAAQS
jgi:hypothetical protein